MINDTFLPGPRPGGTTQPTEPATALSEAVRTVEAWEIAARMTALKAFRDELDEAVVAAAGAAAEEGWDSARIDAVCPGYTRVLASSLRLAAVQT